MASAPILSNRPRTALVVGAGVVGVATAYALARRGVQVTLVDRQQGPGLGASFANGAQLSYLYTDALASPAMLPQIPALLLGRVDAFRLRFSADPEYIAWLLLFLRNCTAARFAQNTLGALQLTLESRAAMADLLAAHPLDFAHEITGKLNVYRSRTGFARMHQIAALKRPACVQAGTQQRIISAAEAVELEPALAGTAPDIVGALYSPSEAVGDAQRFCTGLLAVLQNEYGVQTRFGWATARIDLSNAGCTALSEDGEQLHTDIAILCTGVDANTLLRPHGLKVPVIAMKGYSLTAPPGAAAPRLSITEMDARFVVSNLGGQIRIAGLADLGQRDTTVDPRRFAALLERAQSILPNAADYAASYQHWAGLRPMSPNSRPLIARPRPALAYNLGHGALGWTMAMGSGERLAKLVMAD